MEKENFYDKAINWAKRKGFSGIKANYEGFDIPSSFTKLDKNKEEVDQYIPDITGKKLGTKSFVEISLKSDETDRQISKWKLLSSLAAARGGKLFLLAPRGHKAFTEKLVKDYSLPAQVENLS
ncbi:MAG: hypothetical protein GYB31_01225 [Bacteroidetes bacterium]|nr:hypothetical protein [Bacteroidota bacterium]